MIIIMSARDAQNVMRITIRLETHNMHGHDFHDDCWRCSGCVMMIISRIETQQLRGRDYHDDCWTVT